MSNFHFWAAGVLAADFKSLEFTQKNVNNATSASLFTP